MFSERTSKALLSWQLLLLALPAYIFLALGAIYMIALSWIAPFVIELDAAYVMSVLTAWLGLGALVLFYRLALGFLDDGASHLQRRRRLFYGGAALSLLPLYLTVHFSGLLAVSLQKANGDDLLLRLYGSGLPLLVPAFHLWLEMTFRHPTPLAADGVLPPEQTTA